jgi:3-deoxy-D-manno-octulosonic-acid transferase
MILAYNFLLGMAIVICSPVILLFSLFDLFQFRERFGFAGPMALDSRRSVLLHGASLGEIGVIRKLLPGLREKYPGHVLIVSSATKSGRDSALKETAGLVSHALILPVDWPGLVRKMIRRCRPDVVVVAETELWPNFIRESKRAGARVALVNGRISDRALPKYLFLKPLFKKVLGCFDALGVQSEAYRRRFMVLGAPPDRISVTGNLKAVLRRQDIDEKKKRRLKASLGFDAAARVFIAASTRPGEEEIILTAFRRLKMQIPALSLVLAPRHLKRVAEITSLLTARQIPFRRKSDPASAPAPVLLLDTLGELSSLFAAADVAFVGATLVPLGGHNLLEPLPFLVPVCFGPHVGAQRESARGVLDHGCGAAVDDGPALSSFVARVLSDPDFRATLRRNIERFLKTTDAPLTENLRLMTLTSG